MRVSGTQDFGFDFGGAEDIFSNLFRFRGMPAHHDLGKNHFSKGMTLETRLDITLEEAYTG